MPLPLSVSLRAGCAVLGTVVCDALMRHCLSDEFEVQPPPRPPLAVTSSPNLVHIELPRLTR